jgi:hypothetical protein
MNTAVLDFQDSQSVALRPSVGVKVRVTTPSRGFDRAGPVAGVYHHAKKKIDWGQRAKELHGAFGDPQKPEVSGSFGGFLL